MLVNGKSMRTIWLSENGSTVEIIDQTRLPHEFTIVGLNTLDDATSAIKNMLVRGAPLIGVTAAYGMALSMSEDDSDFGIENAYKRLFDTRPTAVNLRWALNAQREMLMRSERTDRQKAAYALAAEIADQDVKQCSLLGGYGKTIIEDIWKLKGKPDNINILTHCNAGWLAAVDWGTALAPIYKAHQDGIPVHVWVDETRPRNQGASLTCWELGQHGVSHTLIVDNVGGHIMQHGLVDMCIVGSDRTTAAGDVCNKIGTYLKALAAFDNNIPFYVGLPGPTIDWTIKDGVCDIPIEQRDEDEVIFFTGLGERGGISKINISPVGTSAANFAFDVTPARLISGLITERGIADASEKGLAELYPEHS